MGGTDTQTGNDAHTGFKRIPHGLCFEPYVIRRIYGNLKIHKKDMHIRPIISSTNNMGRNLMVVEKT